VPQHDFSQIRANLTMVFLGAILSSSCSGEIDKNGIQYRAATMLSTSCASHIKIVQGAELSHAIVGSRIRNVELTGGIFEEFKQDGTYSIEQRRIPVRGRYSVLSDRIEVLLPEASALYPQVRFLGRDPEGQYFYCFMPSVKYSSVRILITK
jgi:hypothetical protein